MRMKREKSLSESYLLRAELVKNVNTYPSPVILYQDFGKKEKGRNSGNSFTYSNWWQ
jgi:hypothetical protein